MKATRKQALRIAQRLGCYGAHQSEDGSWMPCKDHETFMAVSRGETVSTTSSHRKSLVEQRAEKVSSFSPKLFETREQALQESRRNGCNRIRVVVTDGIQMYASCMPKNNGRPENTGLITPNKRDFEKLTERGVTGIDTLSGGGLVSGKDDIEEIDSKGFVNYVSRSTDPDVYSDPDSARVRSRQLGCIGIRSYTARDGKVVYLPCTNGSDYNRVMNIRPDGRPKKKKEEEKSLGRNLRGAFRSYSSLFSGGVDRDGDGFTTGHDGQDNVPAPKKPKKGRLGVLNVDDRGADAPTEPMPGESRDARGFDADPEEPSLDGRQRERRLRGVGGGDIVDDSGYLNEQDRLRKENEARLKRDNEIRSLQTRIVDETVRINQAIMNEDIRKRVMDSIKENRKRLSELLTERENASKPKEKSLAKTPAPKKDKIIGSGKNRIGSAGSISSAGDISMNEDVIKTLVMKVREHNESVKKKDNWSKTNLRALKAVYRRGAGAFSVSHRPGMNRNQWAMGRVNAFLRLLSSGSAKASYTTDNDLLPKGHPWKKRGIGGKSFIIDNDEFFAESIYSSVSYKSGHPRKLTRFIAFSLDNDGQ
jgi:hypothetical protein